MHSTRRNAAQLVRFSGFQCSFSGPHSPPDIILTFCHPVMLPSCCYHCLALCQLLARFFTPEHKNRPAGWHIAGFFLRFLLPDVSRMPFREFSGPHFHIGGQRGVSHYGKSRWPGATHFPLISLDIHFSISYSKIVSKNV